MQKKQAKVYEAAEAVDGMNIKKTKMSHKSCSPGEFGSMVKQSFNIGDHLPAAGYGALGGAGLGALSGLINPGEEDEYDEDGNVIGRKQRGRFGAALRNALMGAGVGGAAGVAGSAMAPEYTQQAIDAVRGMFGAGQAQQPQPGAELAGQALPEAANMQSIGNLGGTGAMQQMAAQSANRYGAMTPPPAISPQTMQQAGQLKPTRVI